MTYSSPPAYFPSFPSTHSHHLSGLWTAEFKEAMRQQKEKTGVSSWLLKFRQGSQSLRSQREFGDYVRSEGDSPIPQIMWRFGGWCKHKFVCVWWGGLWDLGEWEVVKSGIETGRKIDPTLHFPKVKCYRRTKDHQTAS